MQVCTIVARNYLAHARVLAASLERHRAGRLAVLVLDDREAALDDTAEPYDLLRPGDIGIDRAELHRRAAIYTVTELATSVKAVLVLHLLRTGHDEVLYLDPDMLALAPIHDVGELIRRHGLVLTPHATAPIPRDGRWPTEGQILQSGVFNLGFLGVGPGAKDFLDWWDERLRRDCVSAIEQGLFVDQRWVDLASTYFPHHVLRDPTVNLAYWNADSRPVAWDGEQYTVGGRPLRLAHFSGYDPRSPHILSSHPGDRPRVLLSEQPALARLSREYGHELFEAGFDDVTTVAWGFNHTAAGLPLDRRMRRIYRQALIHAEAGNEAMPPDAFDPAGARAFVAWLNRPAPMGATGLWPRYLAAVRDERGDVQAAFPDELAPEGLISWARAHGASMAVPPELIPEDATPAVPPARDYRPGVNVAGYLRAESGVGEAARLTVSALKAAGVPYSVVTYRDTLSRQEDPFADAGAGTADFATNVVCVNADQLPRFALGEGKTLFDGRHTVGVWMWEVEVFPPSMARAGAFVDEIWAPSAHTRNAIAAAVAKPVHVFPLPVVTPSSPALSRAELGLPDDRFVFLFSFSFHSSYQRKNPVALVQAFTRAFRPDEGPVLVVKSTHGDLLPALEHLRAVAGDRPDIVIVNEVFGHDRQQGLMASCDAFVSLHRAEGFGLHLAEAMALGKPTVATAYSGNLEFMTDDNSWLVPYELVPVGAAPPYPPEARWAEPDVDAAAAILREIHDDPSAAKARGARAADDIRRLHSPGARAEFIRRRLAEARPPRRPAPPAAVPAPPAAPASVLDRLRAATPPEVKRLIRRLRGTAPPTPPEARPLPPAVEVQTDRGLVLVPEYDQVILPWVRHWGTWEPAETAVFREVVRPGMTVVDVGAHVGLHAITLGELVGPEGRVIALEPEPRNYALLLANLERTGTRNVEPLEMGAWSEPTTIALDLSEQNSGDHRARPAPGGIRAVRLDDLVPAPGTVDLVKIDVQGAEHVVVAGMTGLLARGRPVVMAEFSPEDIRSRGDDPTEVVKGYTALGFATTSLNRHGETGPGADDPAALIAWAEAQEGAFVTLVLRQ